MIDQGFWLQPTNFMTPLCRGGNLKTWERSRRGKTIRLEWFLLDTAYLGFSLKSRAVERDAIYPALPGDLRSAIMSAIGGECEAYGP